MKGLTKKMQPTLQSTCLTVLSHRPRWGEYLMMDDFHNKGRGSKSFVHMHILKKRSFEMPQLPVLPCLHEPRVAMNRPHELRAPMFPCAARSRWTLPVQQPMLNHSFAPLSMARIARFGGFHGTACAVPVVSRGTRYIPPLMVQLGLMLSEQHAVTPYRRLRSEV